MAEITDARKTRRTKLRARLRKQAVDSWNAKTPEQRAYEIVYGACQTEPEWYALGAAEPYYAAGQAWQNGEMGAVEACEHYGQSLADR